MLRGAGVNLPSLKCKKGVETNAFYYENVNNARSDESSHLIDKLLAIH
jgi:hypothetical protein